MFSLKSFILVFGLLFSSFMVGFKEKEIPKSTEKDNTKIASGCYLGYSRTVLDINNVRTTLLNGGDLWWDLDNARYEVPKTNNQYAPKKNAIFAGAVWLGGRDQPTGGNVLVTSQTYRHGVQYAYWPGPIDQNVMDISQSECSQWDRHFTVYSDSILEFRNKFQNGQITNVTQIKNQILGWPAKGNPHIGTAITQMSGANMNRNLAPFVDVNNDGIYNPMQGDYPDIKGNQSIWWVMNDVGNTKQPFSNPIGLEMQVEAYGCNDCFANNTTFYSYKIINKSPNALYETYFTQWVDT
jgi:hypothetical protein